MTLERRLPHLICILGFILILKPNHCSYDNYPFLTQEEILSELNSLLAIKSINKSNNPSIIIKGGGGEDEGERKFRPSCPVYSTFSNNTIVIDTLLNSHSQLKIQENAIFSNINQNQQRKNNLNLKNSKISNNQIDSRLGDLYFSSEGGGISIKSNKENYLSSSSKLISNKIQSGGFWEPDTCQSLHNVAILIPFRNRYSQLVTFLHYIHIFLQLQLIRYQIFVIEQNDRLPFNRGKLLNVGFLESNKIRNFDCFIFHDVDLLPEILANIYTCVKNPRHMSSAIDSFRYTLMYETLFGGAISILKEQFEKVNGFSNNYFGWGSEDDDLFQRLKNNLIPIVRFSKEISSYRMMAHKKEEPSEDRIKLLKSADLRFSSDGLNTLNYTISKIIKENLYTLIKAKL